MVHACYFNIFNTRRKVKTTSLNKKNGNVHDQNMFVYDSVKTLASNSVSNSAVWLKSPI